MKKNNYILLLLLLVGACHPICVLASESQPWLEVNPLQRLFPTFFLKSCIYSNASGLHRGLSVGELPSDADIRDCIRCGANPYKALVYASALLSGHASRGWGEFHEESVRHSLHFLFNFVDVNATAPSGGVTLLSTAIARRDENLAKLLCERGADPRIPTKLSARSHGTISHMHQIHIEEQIDEVGAKEKRSAKEQAEFDALRARLAKIKELVEGRMRELQKEKR